MLSVPVRDARLMSNLSSELLSAARLMMVMIMFNVKAADVDISSHTLPVDNFQLAFSNLELVQNNARTSACYMQES